ncbi:MAG TPA: hypothetical protein VFT62_03180 [Mycobacteriales bacterium]|nr:hypothetical protein [Mycobacteriales bacterium]
MTDPTNCAVVVDVPARHREENVVLAVLVIASAAAAVLGLAFLGMGRRSRFDDVARFHRASAMTSEWARSAVTQPFVAAPETPADVAERASADTTRPAAAPSGRR